MTKLLRWYYVNHKLFPDKFSICELAAWLGNSYRSVHYWLKGRNNMPLRYEEGVTAYMKKKITDLIERG